MSSNNNSSGETEIVVEPVPFPLPQIVQGAARRVKIQLGDTIVEKYALLTARNNVFELGRVLKDAIYGHVYHAMQIVRVTESQGDLYSRTNPVRQFAIKVYSKDRIRSYRGKTQENPMNELSAIQYLDEHPNLLHQVDCCEDTDNVYSVMPYCDGGELYDMIEVKGALKENVAKFYFIQIVHGLSYLQEKGVVHRDMSLENIMFDSMGKCYIIDFGMALCIPVNHPSIRHDALDHDGAQPVLNHQPVHIMIPYQGVCGKRNYIAPEVMDNSPLLEAFRVDIWALGIILFIMLTGVPPVDKASPADQRYRLICSGMLANMIQQWGFRLSEQAVDLLERILKPVPRQRLTIPEILQHPWVTGATTG